MRSLGRILIQYDWYPHKKEKFGQRYTYREDDVKGHREKMAITSQAEALNRSFFHSHQKEPTLLTP